MDNVVPFKRPEPPEPDVQHGSGKMFCIGCKHEWVAAAPTGLTEFECPNCGTMKGKWKFEFSPSEDQMVLECGCGNQLYYLTPEGHMCANCGIYKRY